MPKPEAVPERKLEGHEIGDLAVRGVAALGVRTLIIRLMGLSANLVLARLLTPHDFGLMAFGLAVVGFGGFLTDGGLGAALEQLPGLRSNWSLRSSFRARRLLTMHRREWDALLFHTLTAALLSRGVMRRVPTVISLDGTPANLDEVAAGYQHSVGSPRVEAAKRRVAGASLRAAAALVAWSGWVRDSLVGDYGVDPAVIHLIPAGTRVPTQPPVREPRERPRALFVGGQFEHKGGETLLRAVDGLDIELHIVTQSQFAPRAGITVNNGVRPGSDVLEALYADSDLFILPTAADAVRAAIERLLDPALRVRMGVAGHARAAERFDADCNARRVLDVMIQAAGRGT